MIRKSSLLVVIAASIASAQQTVQGRITDRTSGFPLAGVVVSGTDANGAALVRTVSDSASGYRLPLTPGMTTLHFRRIGYSPADVALADSVNGRVDVSMSRLPTQLPPIKATVAAQCDADANTEDVLALWEQARLGLLTSMVARESKAGYTSVLTYQNDFKGDDEMPRSVKRIELPPGISVPFIAGGEPDSLAKYGYLAKVGFLQTFLGPDDRVLFDESFLATHCFTTEGAPGDSLVGIRFRGGKGTKLVGVEGTLWLRRDPLDLASMEYLYTNLDRAMQRVRPGGSVHFRRMPNGITMIDEWRIRGAISVSNSARQALRQTVMIGKNGQMIQQPVPTTRYRDETAVANETGAMIEMMQWPDAPPYLAKLASVTGLLTDKYTKAPLANTVVHFYRTPFAATTDSTGRFSIEDVLPGVYEVDIGDTELEKYGAAGDLVGPIAIKYGPNTVDLIGEGPEAVVARGCGEKVDGRVDMPKQLAGKYAVFGVVTPETRPASQIEFVAEVLPGGAVAGTPTFPLKGKTDKAGRFRLCNLPNGTVKITARAGGMAGAQTFTLGEGRVYKLTTIQMAKPGGP